MEAKAPFKCAVQYWRRHRIAIKRAAPIIETEYELVIKPVGLYHDSLIDSIAICVPDDVGGGFVNSEFQLADVFLAKRPLGIPAAEFTDKAAGLGEFVQMAPNLQH